MKRGGESPGAPGQVRLAPEASGAAQPPGVAEVEALHGGPWPQPTRTTNTSAAPEGEGASGAGVDDVEAFIARYRLPYEQDHRNVVAVTPEWLRANADLITSLRADVDRLERERDDAQRFSDHWRSEVSLWNAEVQRLEREAEEMQREYDTMHDQRWAATCEVKRLEREKQDMQIALRTQGDYLSAIYEENKRLERERDEANAAYRTAHDGRTRLADRNRVLEREMGEIESIAARPGDRLAAVLRIGAIAHRALHAPESEDVDER